MIDTSEVGVTRELGLVLLCALVNIDFASVVLDLLERRGVMSFPLSIISEVFKTVTYDETVLRCALDVDTVGGACVDLSA